VSRVDAVKALVPDVLLVAGAGFGAYLAHRGLAFETHGVVYAGVAMLGVCLLLLQSAQTLAKLKTLAEAAKAAREAKD
jgi:hypothetical protein